MNIAVVADLYFSIYSSFVPSMTAALSERHRVFILTPMAPGAPAFREARPYATVLHVGYPFPSSGLSLGPSLVWGAFQAVWALWREKIDAAHVHIYTTHAWLWGWVLAAARVPYVVTFHLANPHPRTGLAGWLLRWQTHRLLSGRAAAVTAVSENIRAKLRRADGRNGKLSVVPIAVAPPRPRARAARAPRGPYALSFSGWNWVKGGDRLLLAFRDLAGKRPGLSLVLCGPGGRRFAGLVKLLKLEDRVVLNDHVPHDEALALIRGCLFYAQLSRYESFGLSILEAMAEGKPVLVSDTVGLATYLRHGANAWLVDPLDVRAVFAGMDRLAGDASLRRRLAGAAAATAKELSWPNVAPRYEELYRLAAASGSGAAA